ncbi:MAG TPA: serine/threonine-protein kinase [Gemmatimonadaceae bacterium]|nr:serine/threonine-protein kinase [Gemmatimonadaceae bacterium]
MCDAPAPVVKRSVPSGEFRSGEFVRFQRPPAELQDLYNDLVKALAPNIRVLGMVGEGGMALVFVGRDSVLKREVAVKLLAPTLADDHVARKRFTREAEAIAAVSHPNIVNVYHVGEVPGRSIPYFVMQYVDGPTLGMGALRGRMLTELRVRRLMADVAAGLAAAHRRKVYHRDIKPSNIVLDGETGRALVLDFGISAAYSSRRHSLGRRLTDEGMYLGTPTYMSPEQGSGEEVTGKSDVYSLGVLAFELLVGRPPFEGSPVRVMAAHMNETPPRIDELRSDVSEEFTTLIARCLEKSPSRRPTAEDIVHFLNPAERNVVEWPPPGMSGVRGVGARLIGAATATSAAVAVFFAALGVWPEFAILRHVGAESSVLRSFVLGAGLAVAFSAATVFVFYALLALQRWRWAVGSGYPVWVIADVFADTRRDSGSLINGTGDFVLVAGPVRQRLLAVRRGRFALLLAGAVAGLAGIGAWIAAWLSSGGSDPAETVAVRWAFVILLTYLAFFLGGIPESRVRRRERGRGAGRDAAPPLRGELVQMWMASAERARKSLAGDPTINKDGN